MIKKDAWRYDYIGDATWKLDRGQAQKSYDEVALFSNGEASEGESDNRELYDAMEKLEPRYKDIIWNLFFEGETLKSYGEKNGYTKQYSHQLRNKAIAALRELMK